MDSQVKKVTMIVAIPDYGMKHRLYVRDYMPDMTDSQGFHEITILDWVEKDMEIVVYHPKDKHGNLPMHELNIRENNEDLNPENERTK